MKDQILEEGDVFKFKADGVIWTVSKQFMSGAFGEVFRITNKKNETRAMKMEVKKAKDVLSRLKIEARVLNDMANEEGFPKLFLCGRTSTRNYIVMENLGPDISRIRRSLPGKRYTVTTAMRISAKILQRLESLHRAGWLYRDVKPQNFAIGTGENSKQVYILDFGMTRRAIDKKRNLAPAAGTFRYISLHTSIHKEQSYRDDLEAWVYMTIELVTGKLPWAAYNNQEHFLQIMDMKNYSHSPKGRKELCAAFPAQFEEIFQKILALNYNEYPDYETLKVLFGQIVFEMKVDEDTPLDWEENERVIRCASKIGDWGESNYLPALMSETTQHGFEGIDTEM